MPSVTIFPQAKRTFSGNRNEIWFHEFFWFELFQIFWATVLISRNFSIELIFFYLFTGQSYTDWKKPEAPKEPDKPQFPEEKKKEIMDKEKVWVSEPQEGFVLGQIVDLTDEGALVQPLSSKFKSIQGIIISNSNCNFTKKIFTKK